MSLLTVSLIILYVQDMDLSRSFYEQLFRIQPFDASPTFTIYILPNGLKLGLWKRDVLEPRPTGIPGACELDCLVEDVDAWYANYTINPIGSIVQLPTTMEFGRTCMIADPDGHRIRIYRLERRVA